jgi:glycosyltransferase involved in cell wall biosynthesis
MNYDPQGLLAEMTAECRGRVWANSRDFELIEASEKGGVRAFNRAAREAKGDYIVFLCNDFMVDDPEWLERLAKPGTVTSWKWTEFHLTGEPELEASCLCMPREILDAVPWDEAYDGGLGYGDNDFLLRVRNAGYATEAIPIRASHLESRTISAYFMEEDRVASFRKNLDLFLGKWPDHRKYLS